MPAVSQAQQQAAAIAKHAKEEGKPLKKGSPSAQMAKGMSGKESDKFASTKRKGLPKHVKKESFDKRLEDALFDESLEGTDQMMAFRPGATKVKKCPRCGARWAEDPSCGGSIHKMLPHRPT